MGKKPAISGVVQAEAGGLVFALVRLLPPQDNILEEATTDVCSFVYTVVFWWHIRKSNRLRAWSLVGWSAGLQNERLGVRVALGAPLLMKIFEKKEEFPTLRFYRGAPALIFISKLRGDIQEWDPFLDDCTNEKRNENRRAARHELVYCLTTGSGLVPFQLIAGKLSRPYVRGDRRVI
jgi:hypothetical protein